MKKASLILSLPLMAVACIKPGIPEGGTPLSGCWAEVSEARLTDRYLDFSMGKCYTYVSATPHVCRDSAIWGCAENDFKLEYCEHYHCSGDRLMFENISRKFTLDGTELVLEDNDGKTTSYVKFNAFRRELWGESRIDSVVVSKNFCLAAVGDSIQLEAAVYPSPSSFTIRWTSDNSEIASVSPSGKVTVHSSGYATIYAYCSIDDSRHGFCSITAVTDLNASAGGSANCYIVPNSGIYRFNPARRGSSDSLVGVIDSAALVWASAGTAKVPGKNDIVFDVDYNREDSLLYFKAGAVEGNAVVAVFNQGRIVWSWHLWLCRNYDADAYGQVYYNNAGTMMDRNLGALSASLWGEQSQGMYYQWGRKDPFPGPVFYKTPDEEYWGLAKAFPDSIFPSKQIPPKGIGDAIAYSVSHPATLIAEDTENGTGDWDTREDVRWMTEDGAKSQYDPCPYGWRVPHVGSRPGENIWETALQGSPSDISKAALIGGFDMSGWLSPDLEVWYPTTGIFDADNARFSYFGIVGVLWTDMIGNLVGAGDAERSVKCLTFLPSDIDSAVFSVSSSLNPTQGEPKSITPAKLFPVRCCKETEARKRR